MFFEEEFISQSEDVSISAKSVLIEEETSLWGYCFYIENTSNQKISLVGKDWNITDDRGNIFNDSSDGFRGEIPELEPGEVFEFSDVAPINSSSAVFYGSCKVLKNNSLCSVNMPCFMMDNKVSDLYN